MLFRLLSRVFNEKVPFLMKKLLTFCFRSGCVIFILFLSDDSMDIQLFHNPVYSLRAITCMVEMIEP